MEKKTAREKEEIIAERKDKAEQTKFKLCRQGPMNQADPLSKDIFQSQDSDDDASIKSVGLRGEDNDAYEEGADEKDDDNSDSGLQRKRLMRPRRASAESDYQEHDNRAQCKSIADRKAAA